MTLFYRYNMKGLELPTRRDKRGRGSDVLKKKKRKGGSGGDVGRKRRKYRGRITVGRRSHPRESTALRESVD